MKILAAVFLFSFSSFAFGASDACTCKCVVKADDGYSTRIGAGKDREAAGDELKKNLGDKKCEISPACTGKCKAD